MEKIIHDTIIPNCAQTQSTDIDTNDTAITRYSITEEDYGIYSYHTTEGGLTTRVVRYTAHVIVKTFADFGLLSEVAEKYRMMRRNAETRGVGWCLTEETEELVKFEARGLAVRNTVQHAYDYAMIVGVEEDL
ncbi:hypothetical protein BS50DRAFT_671381 [Corynespora cassiicola Philippines]|uniref:Uncharacterized protein n=1 Tax=Corynespora cassiicola Philippines TaxID=1448308 RepID=A0A2T2PC95_CORCC|nr:hypothetical protein BS50DRAFT_671381 [Corynespora cassiicola Philippines]